MKSGRGMLAVALAWVSYASWLGTAASAQSFNIDVGMLGNSPPSSYGAAGAPGFWNRVTADHVVPFSTGRTPEDVLLVDLDGVQTNVGFHQFGGMDLVSTNDPSVTGDDASLMNDYLATHNAILESCAYLNGLEDGTYEVLTYAWMPNEPTIFQKVRFDFHADIQTVGGAWPGGQVEGVTYSRHVIEVTNGFMGLHVGIPNGGNTAIGAALNAIQVRPLGEDPIVGCGRGSVNAGCGATADVLFVNGQTGGASRTVTVTPTTPLSLTVAEPDSRRGDSQPTRACIYLWVGAPSSSDTVSLPQGLGDMCFGPKVLATKSPKKTWNALGFFAKLGTHTGPGPAPVIPDDGLFQFLNLPLGVRQSAVVTFQGIIEDDCSQGATPISVTNGFVLRVQ